MRVAIAGAGAVGRSIAQSLLAVPEPAVEPSRDGRGARGARGARGGHGTRRGRAAVDRGTNSVRSAHKVLLIERSRPSFQPDLVPDADWMLADSCELGALRTARIELCDVVAAASGDDKVNLVFALLCKTEFAVPRVVARVNNPDNQWLFTESWGVDVAVSTPARLVAAVEEAVAVGDLVRLRALERGLEHVVEVRLPADTVLAGRRVGELGLPDGATIVTILRDGELVRPDPDVRFQPDDEIVLVVSAAAEPQLRQVLRGE